MYLIMDGLDSGSQFHRQNAKNHWVGGVWDGEEVLTGLELRAGKARLERLIPGMVSRRYLTTAETDVSRSAAQTRARR